MKRTAAPRHCIIVVTALAQHAGEVTGFSVLARTTHAQATPKTVPPHFAPEESFVVVLGLDVVFHDL